MAEDLPFSFPRMNRHEGKPRSCGVTEVRGLYYTPMGKRFLEDLRETMDEHMDT